MQNSNVLFGAAYDRERLNLDHQLGVFWATFRTMPITVHDCESISSRYRSRLRNASST